MENNRNSASLRGALCIVAGALCFSTSGLVQALAVAEGATPLLIGGIRMLAGGLALFLWCAWRKKLPMRQGWPLRTVALSALGIVGYQLCFFTGLIHSGVAVGTMVTMGFTPLVTAVLAWLFLHEKPVAAWYPATALACVGLVLMHWSGGVEASFTDGLFFPLCAGACYAVYLVTCKPLMHKHAPETIMMVLFLLCGTALLPLLYFEPTAWLFSVQGVLIVLHLGLVTAALGYCLTLAGLQQTPAAIASTLGLAEPLCAALLGFFCLGEVATGYSILGMLFLFISALVLIILPQCKFSK
jgi:drug/metabolite transporter, DME family